MNSNQIHKGIGTGRRYLTALTGAVLMFATLCFCPSRGFAQVTTADLLGNVTDAQGAAIPNAAVKVESAETHQQRAVMSGGDGAYDITALEPGTYRLTVTANGFKSFNADHIVVVGGDRARVDAKLEVGSATEEITVTADMSALQTDSTNVGTTIVGQSVQDLPINGRNYMAMVQIAAGVNPGSPSALSAGGRLDDRRPTSAISANGQPETSNNQMVDGLDNSSRWNATVELRPSVEAIQELRTDVNTYNAEVGRTQGAAINILTKSGTNDFHGSAFEFFRNDVTDARNFFADSASLPRKPELRQNQFGGSFGGPIIRNKTFFFSDLEIFKRIDATNSVYLSSVPTVFEQQNPGNLSDINGGVVSPSQIDPTSLAYFKMYPLPNRPSTTQLPAIPQNNFLYNPALVQTIYLGDIRVDHHIDSNNLVFGRYSHNLTTTLVPAYFPVSSTGAVSAGVQAAPAPSNTTQVAHNAMLGYTHIFGSTLVLEAKAGYMFFSGFAVPLNYGKNWNDTAPYLIPNANACVECSGLANIGINGSYGSLGDQTQAPADRRENSYELESAVTWTHGPHTIKIGGTVSDVGLEVIQQYFKAAFTFTGNTPQLALTNFFKGTPVRFQRTVTLTMPHYKTWEPAVFAQDNWRLFPKLTLNLGLRYEVFSPASEKNGNNSRYDLDTMQMITSKTGGSQADLSDFNPRVGFAFSPISSFVVRGGFGMSHFPSDFAQGLQLANPPQGYQTGTLTMTTPISQGVSAPTLQSPANSSLFGAIAAKPANFHHAYVEQFNLLVQKDVHGNVVTAGYVGELGRHLFEQVPNINIPVPVGPSATGATPPPAPYASVLPKVNTINYWGDFGTSSYHSLQLTMERRLSKGISANLNYTLAHAIDDANNAQSGENAASAFGLIPTRISSYDRGNSYTDVRSRIAGTFTYSLPFGKGGSFSHQLVAGGWQVNGLGFWQTGNPIAVTSTYTQNGVTQINISSAVTSDRPNRGSGDAYAHGELNFLNPAAFVKQPLGTAGNIGRNQYYGPHLRRGDLSVFKTVKLREATQAQFRVECFNITNTPNFAQPNSVISAYSPTADSNGNFEATTAKNFGQITSTAFSYANRQFQFALRLLF